MGILYLTQSPSSPFSASYIDTSNHTLLTNSSNTNTTGTDTNTTTTRLKYSDPVPDRGWFNWNHGRIFDPVLVGYIPIPPSSSNSISSDSSVSPDASKSKAEGLVVQEEKALPPGYVDLRWRGIGLIVDFNWRRTEEGMIYEGYTGQPLPPSLPSPTQSTSADKASSTETGNAEKEKNQEKDVERRPWFFEPSAPTAQPNDEETDHLKLEEKDASSRMGQLDKFSKKAIELREKTQKKVGQLWSPGWKKAKLLEDL